MLYQYLSFLVVAIVAVPLLFGAFFFLWGSAHPGRTFRVAAWLATLQLLLTCTACGFGLFTKIENEKTNQKSSFTDPSFRPVLVPGAAPQEQAGNSRDYETTANILEFYPTSRDVPPAAIQFYLGLDGINIWLVLLTSLLMLVAVLVSNKTCRLQPAQYFGWLFTLQAAIIGAFLSFDVILFYVFFELTLIPTFFLIGNWGVGGARRDAARKFFLYTLFGGLITLVGIIGLVLTNPTPLMPTKSGNQRAIPNESYLRLNPELELQPGPITFSIPRLMHNANMWSATHPIHLEYLNLRLTEAEQKVPSLAKAAKAPNANLDAELAYTAAQEEVVRRQEAVQRIEDKNQARLNIQAWLFFALIAGFVVKIPLIPFHTWLPSAYGEAPMAVTLLMTGLLSKLGTIALLRVVLPLCPDPVVEYGLPTFGFLGAVGIIYAAFCAYAQRDMKMVAAYSSVSHLGLLVLGTFALNPEGISGAALHMVNHGLTAGAMFALLAFLYDRYQTTDINQYSGLMGVFPVYAFFTFFIALASIGLPGLNNFVSEMLLISALFTPANIEAVGYGLATAACAGVFLSAWYLFSMLRKVFFGPVSLPQSTAVGFDPAVKKPLTINEYLAFGMPCILCLVLGLYPQPVIDSLKSDANLLERHLHGAKMRQNLPVSQLENPNLWKTEIFLQPENPAPEPAPATPEPGQ